MSDLKTATTIINITAETWGVKPSDIQSKSHREFIPLARSIAIMLILEHTDYVHKEIADMLGKAGPSTIGHSRNAALRACMAPAVKNSVHVIEKRLKRIINH